MARYEAGETLASIARTYDCSPPAISYIVSRSRGRGVAPSVVAARRPASPEPPLIESRGTEVPVHVSGQDDAATEQIPVGVSAPASLAATTDQTNQATLQHGIASDQGEGVPEQARSARDDRDKRNNTQAAGYSETGVGLSRDHRPQQILHLSQPHLHDEHAAGEHHRSDHGSNPSDELAASHLTRGHKDLGHSDRQWANRDPPGGNGADAQFVQDQRPSKEGGTFIDLALRHRVQSDIEAFLAAFDAALSLDTSETRAGLREATDRLLRAGARTRIELERLEARAPLPVRDGSGQPELPWRQR
jgi:hypothetical protein